MPVKMGPVLSFRGCEGDQWSLTAVIVADTAPVLTCRGQPIAAVELWKPARRNDAAWRYTFTFPMTDSEQRYSYDVDGKSYDVVVPAKGQVPTMAYESCNGYSSSKLMKSVKDSNYLWKTMARKHGFADPQSKDDNAPVVKDTLPYHLLLQGGDQVYADSMWEVEDVMKNWLHLSWDDGNAAKVTNTMRDRLEGFFFDLYTKRWNQPEVARILACVPSIAMWDDHDLIDGWGSYPPERQNCAVYGAIWCAAAKAFSVFQQHLTATERRPGTIGTASANWWMAPAGPNLRTEDRIGTFSFGYIVGSVAILALDMRSQRTADTQVIGAKHWDDIYDWMKALDAANISHLLVMSSIPVVYPGFDTLETLLGFVPGHQDLEDDLRDHWSSRPHKDERTRLVHKLLDFPKAGIRVTLLSGDVHVAALGIIKSNRAQDKGDGEAVINQLISSGIVHPGPGAVVVFTLQHLFDSSDAIDRDIFGSMIQFPGSQARFIGSRNYLSIEPDQAQPPVKRPRLWCNWLVEDEKFPYTKVVHPIPRP